MIGVSSRLSITNGPRPQAKVCGNAGEADAADDLAQAKEPQDCQYHDDKTDDINEAIHGISLLKKCCLRGDGAQVSVIYNFVFCVAVRVFLNLAGGLLNILFRFDAVQGSIKPFSSRSTFIARGKWRLSILTRISRPALWAGRFLVRIDVPDDVWEARRILDIARLPIGWSAIPEGKVSLDIGRDWLQPGGTALPMIPSVIVHEEFNVLYRSETRGGQGDHCTEGASLVP